MKYNPDENPKAYSNYLRSKRRQPKISSWRRKGKSSMKQDSKILRSNVENIDQQYNKEIQ